MEIKEFIGIDPDLKKSGLAIYRDGVLKTSIQDFQTILNLSVVWDDRTEIRIEAGWLNNSNFHIKPSDSPQVAAEIGRRVGENHATGKLLAECLSRGRAKVKLVRPTNKKVSKKKFEEVSGITISSQEEIDSAMLIFDKWRDKQ